MALLYIDTNVYLDYFEGRVDNLRPLGEFAYQIFQRTLSCEFHIVISSHLLKELRFIEKDSKIEEFLEEFKEKNKIIFVACSFEDKQFANLLSKQRKTPFADTLHAVIAKRIGAEYLITRNIKDYTELQDVIRILLPEFL